MDDNKKEEQKQKGKIVLVKKFVLLLIDVLLKTSYSAPAGSSERENL